MLAGDGADEEEAEAGAFDLDGVAAGDAVEALEDALELVGLEAHAGVGDGEGDVGVADEGERAADVDGVGGVFDGVVQKVEDGGAQVFRDAEDVEVHAERNRRELDGGGGQVVALEGDGDAVGDERGEFDLGAFFVAMACPEFTGFEHLLDGGEEAVGVGEHDLVEALALGLGDIAALQGLEVEADGGDGGLELVGDGVEEGVLALVAAQLADEEDSVEDDSRRRAIRRG